jgi:hypothetical protein
MEEVWSVDENQEQQQQGISLTPSQSSNSISIQPEENNSSCITPLNQQHPTRSSSNTHTAGFSPRFMGCMFLTGCSSKLACYQLGFLFCDKYNFVIFFC